MDSRVPPLNTLMPLEVAKLIWNVAFKPEYFNFNEIKYDVKRTWEIELTDYRKKAIGNLKKLVENKEIPSFLELVLQQRIFLLREAYHQLFLWKITYDPFNKIDVFLEGELYAPNYFTMYGSFNDYKWTKRFVLYENYAMTERFRLASSYWLPKECSILLTKLKNSYSASIGDNFNILMFFGSNLGLISLMILHLDFPLIVPETDWRDEVSFWKIGFYHAVEMRYEYAVYFFWKKMPESEKADILEDDSFFDLLSKCAKFEKNEIFSFLFPFLPRERVGALMYWSIVSFNFDIWHTLLLSRFSRKHISNIFEIYCILPRDIFLDLSRLLVHRIKHHHLPHEIKIFLELWRKLFPHEKHLVLKNSALVETLSKRKSFCALFQILRGLSLKQKENCLLNNCYGSGINVIKSLLDGGDFSLLQKYFSIFLIEKDSRTRKEMLRKDAIPFLQKFIESPRFVKWRRKRFSEAQELLIALEPIQASLILLDDLCNYVSKELNPSHYISNICNFERNKDNNRGSVFSFSSSKNIN